MPQWYSSRGVFLALLLPLLFAVSATTSNAQLSPDAIQHVDTGYVYETSFQFGALGLPYGKACLLYHDIGITFSNVYGEDVNLTNVLDPTRWRPYSLPAERQDDSLKAMFYVDTDSCNITLNMAPSLLHGLAGGMWSAENYVEYDIENPGVVPFDKSIWASSFLSTGSYNKLIKLDRHPVWSPEFLKSGPIDLITPGNLMVGRNTYSLNGLKYISGYENLFQHPNGLAYADSSMWFDITLTIAATDLPLDTSTVIANIVLYRRVTIGQLDTINSVVPDSLGNPTAHYRTNYSTCACDLYEAFDTLQLTRAMYDNGMAHGEFKQIPLSFTFPLDVGFAPIPISIDSVRVPAFTRWTRFTSATGGDSIAMTGTAIDTLVTIPAVRVGDMFPAFQPPSELGWFGWGNPAVENDAALLATIDNVDRHQDTANWHNRRYCYRLQQQLRQKGYVLPGDISNTVSESDFYYNVYTTRRATITFQHGRLAPHALTLVGSSAFDRRFDSTVAVLLSDSAQWKPRLGRVHVGDEAKPQNWTWNRMMNSRIQRSMMENHPTEFRGLTTNPIGLSHSFTRFNGDLDSSLYKMTHQLTTQAYSLPPGIPIYYANPRLMHASMPTTLFAGQILHNTIGDYNQYTANILGNMNGRIGVMSSAVDASYRAFRQYGMTPYPVLYVVQVHGQFGDGNGTGGYHGGFLNGPKFRSPEWRTPTKEEVTLQSWSALLQGVDGLLFSDMIYNGDAFGPSHYQTGDYETEYGRLFIDKPYHRDTLETMWIGFKSRSDAIKSIIDTFKLTILPVYMKLKRHAGRYIATHIADYDTIAMFASIKAELPEQDTLNFIAQTPAKFDAADSTYLDVTWFEPDPDSLQAEAAHQVRYMGIVSRRCWPIDHQPDTAYPDGEGKGLGNIAVRRPVIRFRNATTLFADSIRIEKIGGGIDTVVAYNAEIALAWIPPGWGAMYRITPIPTGVGKFGVAFNNAVHAVNPSDATTERPRLYVYSRDSIVYLRTLSPAGAWSQEWMISAAADAGDTDPVSAGWQRAADNFNPAVAVCPDTGSAMIVWERRADDSTTVQGYYLTSLPTTISALPDSVRLTLSSNYKFTDTTRSMKPSIVGVPGGYVASWATPSTGIELIPVTSGSPSWLAPTAVLATSADAGGQTVSADAAFPTLAWVQSHTISANKNGIHLAWQQGLPYGKIFYQELKLNPDMSALTATVVEHVTQGIPVGDCQGFAHPCIAADSIQVGVAFETDVALSKTVLLKFRDPLDTATGLPLYNRHWKTPLHQWGNVLKASPFQYILRWFSEYPSVIQFPRLDVESLLNNPTGALVWFSSNAPSNQPKQSLYRFGSMAETALPPGAWPSLALVPILKATDPLMASSVFYRELEATQFAASRPGGGTTWEQVPRVENTPSVQSPLLSSQVSTRKIHSHYWLGWWQSPPCVDFPGGVISIGIAHRADSSIANPVDDPNLFPRTFPTAQPGVPEMFFQPPGENGGRIRTLEDAVRVGSTSRFTAGTEPVTIQRIIFAGESVLSRLDLFAYDSLMNSGPDIKILTELVRAKDGVVVWSDDTLSVRDVVGTGWNDLVEVPVQSVAALGDSVYIRIRAVPTAEVTYDLAGAFDFMEDSTAGTFEKVGRSRSRPNAIAGEPESLSATVKPNPLQTSGELLVHFTEPGTARITIHDMVGRLLRTLATATVHHAGDYSLELDLSDFRNGMYLVRVEQGHKQVTTRFTVMR